MASLTNRNPSVFWKIENLFSLAAKNSYPKSDGVGWRKDLKQNKLWIKTKKLISLSPWEATEMSSVDFDSICGFDCKWSWIEIAYLGNGMDVFTLRARTRSLSTDSWSSAALVSTTVSPVGQNRAVASARETSLNRNIFIKNQNFQNFPVNFQVILIANHNSCFISILPTPSSFESFLQTLLTCNRVDLPRQKTTIKQAML